jgi:hypothetical protein
LKNVVSILNSVLVLALILLPMHARSQQAPPAKPATSSTAEQPPAGGSPQDILEKWDGGHPCSTEKVNHNCTLTIDRTNLLQPPTLQMYSSAVVTVKITNDHPFETLSLDWQSSNASLMPDPIATIFTTFNSTFAKVALATNSVNGAKALRALVQANNASKTPSDFCAPSVLVSSSAAYTCIVQLSEDSKIGAGLFSPLINPDSVVYPDQKYNGSFSDVRQAAICAVFGPDTPAQDPTIPKCPSASRDLVSDQANIAAWVTNNKTDPANGDIAALSTYTNGLVTALAGFAENLIDLGIPTGTRTFVLGTILDPARRSIPDQVPQSCNASAKDEPAPAAQKGLVQRTITCAVNVINLVANSQDTVPTASLKKLLVSVTVNYADTRIETSAGVLLSALPSRSFAASSTYTGTPPTVSQITAKETDTRPLIVPFAALNVLLRDWICGVRRCGFYATGLAGVNPNTTTADFGAGFSFSWRTLMVSPVAHFAHDVGLTNGITVNEPLGTSFSGSLPTKQFWTTSWGIGLSYRIPLITGR